jgi:Kef-type K+ transport system membrane component KefB
VDQPYSSLLPVVVVTALAPILVGLMPRRYRLPPVVLLLIGGVVIGPQLLDLSSADDVTLLSDLGMGFLFLMAGYELDPALVRERAGRLAIGSWFTSLVLAVLVTLPLFLTGVVHAAIAVSIALTTTALGTLLPIMRENHILHGRFGHLVFAAGAIGELGPIIAMALFLSTRHARGSLVLLVGLALLALLLVYLPTHVRMRTVTKIILRGEHETTQSTLRITVVLLVGLLAVSAALGFDAVLGAFVAGMVLRKWGMGDVPRLEEKLDAVAWGVFIPAFFVSSGMSLDVDSLVDRPLLPVAFLLQPLVVRAGPAMVIFHKELTPRMRVSFGLLTSTTLPLLVALTTIATDDGSMQPDVAAALVGAGALSMLIFPVVAIGIYRGTPEGQAAAAARRAEQEAARSAGADSPGR